MTSGICCFVDKLNGNLADAKLPFFLFVLAVLDILMVVLLMSLADRSFFSSLMAVLGLGILVLCLDLSSLTIDPDLGKLRLGFDFVSILFGLNLVILLIVPDRVIFCPALT